MELGRLPEDLSHTYAQIFEHVRKLGPQSHVIAERSLKWLLCQARDFTEAEFLSAVSIGTERESVNLTKEKILFICGNLVVFDHELKVFRFAHLSVQEYLETQSNFTLGAAHALGAETSLLVCLHRYTELAANYARKFQPYAFLYWVYHCREAKKSGLGRPLHQLLEDFLHIQEGPNLYYAAWARSMHRLGRGSDGESVNWNTELNDDLINGILEEWQPAKLSWSLNRLSETDVAEYGILQTILNDRDHPYDPTFAACFLDLPEIVEQNLQSVLSSPAKKVGDLASDYIKVFERRNVYGETYLHVACHRGSSKLLRSLLQYPVPVRAIDLMRRTALHHAVKPRGLVSSKLARWTDAYDPANAAERVAMIGLLIEKGSIIDAVDCRGQTALHRATRGNCCTEAQFLLENGAFVDAKTYKDQTPLHLAVVSGHTAVARLLLQFKADIEAIDADGKTPLLLAANSARSELTVITQLLLQFKADTEARDASGMTPLLLAVNSGYTAITRLLLHSKAEIEARDSNRRTPLFQTVVKGDRDTCRSLLRFGADINAKEKNGIAPLAESFQMKDEAMAQMLIDEGASIQQSDLSGNTVLHYAAGTRLGASISTLLEMGAYNNETNVYGSTPLHAAIKPHGAVVGFGMRTPTASHSVVLLVDRGAHIDMSDNEGRTPLHLAAQMADEASVQILLDRGANIKAEDSEGLLPLDHAAISGSLQVFSLLFKRWADVMEEGSENAVES